MNLLTPDAVAERLAIAVPTLAKWRARGDGPGTPSQTGNQKESTVNQPGEVGTGWKPME